jgi:integrase/recombinase XerD
MNHSPLGLKLSKALSGFLQYKTAESLSPNTLLTYEHYVKVWLAHTGDKDLSEFTTADLREFFAWLRTEYKPGRFNGSTAPLSPKSLRNTWVALCSFWTWASTEFNLTNPMKGIPAPRFEFPPIEPFTKEEVEKLLKAAEYCREANTERRKKFSMRRSTARRDRAIILFLLDTGLRANELCSLTIADLDPKTGRVQVKHGTLGGAKGGKGRFVYLGKAGRNAMWRYLADREDGEDPQAPLFCDRLSRAIKKDHLRQLLHYMGKRAAVQKTYPHKFRHTFAITYLRNGGDLFTLQSLLGHSSLEMVQHYARIAEVDVEQMHRRASPADNWHL